MYKSHYLLGDFHPSESLHSHTLAPAHWGSRCLCFHSAHPSHPIGWRKWGTSLCPITVTQVLSIHLLHGENFCWAVLLLLIHSVAVPDCREVFHHIWLLALAVHEIGSSGSEVCEQWGRGRAKVPQGGWGAFGDGHQMSLLLLFGANASPWCPDPAARGLSLAQICFSCHQWRCCPGSVSTAAFFPRSWHHMQSCWPGRTHRVGQTDLLAGFLVCTYWGLKLLIYLEKKFNHKRERPMGCFFLHQCNKPRGQKDTHRTSSALKPLIPLEFCGVF